jgi:hypothetical protein
METKMNLKTALKKMDDEINFIKEKKNYVKWFNKLEKGQSIIKKLYQLHLIFYDNSDTKLLDNLPNNTETIAFLNLSEHYGKLTNLPTSLKKILIMDSEFKMSDKNKFFRIPFECEIIFLGIEYNNDKYYTREPYFDKKLYNYYMDILNIYPYDNLYTSKYILGKQMIMNIEIDKAPDGKKVIQPTPTIYCDYYNFKRENEGVFSDIIF